MEMHSVELQIHENKNSVAKCCQPWEMNQGPLTLMPCMLLSGLLNYVSTILG